RRRVRYDCAAVRRRCVRSKYSGCGGLARGRPIVRIQLYDTTLRDGAQREGLSLSVEDKVKIARELDRLGVQYIEGGWPGSNPKDAAFFRRVAETPLRSAKVAAFGSTRHAQGRCEDDANIRALVEAGTPV